MSEPTWIRVSPTDAIPLREGRVVQLGQQEVAVFNLGGRFLAVANRCPHKHGPLADGIVAGETVVCPLHAWRVNLSTGQVERPSNRSECVERYRVRVEDGILAIALPGATAEATEGEAA
jgi:nitrite reductase (NADH) small subunit